MFMDAWPSRWADGFYIIITRLSEGRRTQLIQRRAPIARQRGQDEPHRRPICLSWKLSFCKTIGAQTKYCWEWKVCTMPWLAELADR